VKKFHVLLEFKDKDGFSRQEFQYQIEAETEEGALEPSQSLAPLQASGMIQIVYRVVEIDEFSPHIIYLEKSK
jgi:hypothetical protein